MFTGNAAQRWPIAIGYVPQDVMLELYVLRFGLVHLLSMACLYNLCQRLRCCSAQECCNRIIGVLLLLYRQPLASPPPMPSMRHLLRIFLILALCADGVTGAWAATRMAVKQASQTNLAAGTKAKAGCDTDASNHKAPTSTPAQEQDEHEDCDCGTSASCACGCMLTFHPGRTTPLFAAQHALVSVYLAPPLLPAVHTEVSWVFRPPIC